MLQLFGAKMSRKSYVYPTTRIWDPAHLEMGTNSCLADFVDCYNVVTIRIGSNCTVSQYAYLCTGNHDISSQSMALKAEPISICEGAWICAQAFIGPGVTVEQYAVVAACAVVVKDVDPWTIVGGNPSRVIGTRKLRTES
jgi:putative colanic acid biosynthesis acetyltransferase WcaF